MTAGAFYWNLPPDVPIGFECDRYEVRARWPGVVPDRKPVITLSEANNRPKNL